MTIEFSDDVCPTHRDDPANARITIQLTTADIRRLAEHEMGDGCERYWLSEDEACTLIDMGVVDYWIHQLADGRFAMWRCDRDVARLQVDHPDVWRTLVERRITDDVE